MAVGFATRLAMRSPVAVFPAIGHGGDELMAQLALVPELELVPSPRHASILLVAGEIPSDHRNALNVVHDQLPYPRATVWWSGTPLFSFRDQALDPLMAQGGASDLIRQLRDLRHQLLLGSRESEPDLQPDEPANPWQGKGDHGQGGEGMMGGTPYGRPMAMMGPEMRDGLMLDAWSFSVGPFCHALPAGLMAQVTLQGDVIQKWQVESSPLPVPIDPIFSRALSESVPVVDLEAARARSHLLRLAKMLVLGGLEPLAKRALALREKLKVQTDIPQVVKSCAGFSRLLRRNGFALLGKEIGVLQPEQARELGGFAARAAGIDEDARSESSTYRKLDFAPICQDGGDLQARRRQLLDELEQSVMLMGKAHQTGSLVSAEYIESPSGVLSASQMPMDKSFLLKSLLPGHEWGDAVAVVASLPLAAAKLDGEIGS